MKINRNKTQVMVCNRCEHKDLNIRISNEKIQKNRKVLLPINNFFGLKIDFEIKKQFVQRVALYECETLIIGK